MDHPSDLRRVLERYRRLLEPVVRYELRDHLPTLEAYRALKRGYVDAPVESVARRVAGVAGSRRIAVHPIMSSGYFLGRAVSDVLRERGYSVSFIPVDKKEGRFALRSDVPEGYRSVLVDDLVRTGWTIQRVRKGVPLLVKAPAVVAAKGRPQDFGTRVLGDLSYALIFLEGGPHPRELLMKKKKGTKPFDVIW